MNDMETLKLKNTQENWHDKYREQMRAKYPDKFSAASLADNAGLELRVYEKLDKDSLNEREV